MDLLLNSCPDLKSLQIQTDLGKLACFRVVSVFIRFTINLTINSVARFKKEQGS